MRYLLLISLAACTFYDLQDRATDTAYVCAVGADQPMGLEVFNDADVSEECRESILSDFRAESLSEQSEQALVNGSWALLNYDWIDIKDQSLSLEIDKVRDMLGEQPNGFTLYNWSTAQFESTTYKRGDSAAAYNPHRDQLLLDDYLTPLDGAVVLIHESHHGSGSHHVKCSFAKDLQCDKDNMGAYTASIAMLNSAPSVEDYVDDVISDTISYYETMILE